jgi:hypothetical protein
VRGLDPLDGGATAAQTSAPAKAPGAADNRGPS